MPITFSCSGCANVLKVADTMAGRKGKCPRCGAVNLVPPAGQIQTAPAPRPAAKTAARKVPPVEEEILDPEVVEDDDREEVEDRPKKGKKKKKSIKRRSPLLLLSLIGGGVAFMCLCSGGVGGLVWWMFFSGGIDDELKFMPNNCQVVSSVRVDQLMKSDVFKQLRNEIPEIDKGMAQDMNKEMGLASEDIEEIVVGVGGSVKEVVVVIRSKKALDAKDLQAKSKNFKFTETKIGKYVMYEAQGMFGPTFCVVDKKLLVLGEKEAVRGVLTRDKKPEFSPTMQAAMKKADFSKSVVVVVDIKSLKSKMAAGPGFLGMIAPDAKTLGEMDGADGLVVESKIASDVRLDATILCRDAKSAGDIKKLLDAGLVKLRNNKDVPKEINDLLNINLTISGSDVKGSTSFKVDPLIQAYKKQKSVKQP